jgi:hypothetical protein
MRITRCSEPGEGRTGSLMAPKSRVVKVLGFDANIADDPYKVGRSWSFKADGQHCAIWYYKGSKIASTFGPREVFVKLFGGHAVLL